MTKTEFEATLKPTRFIDSDSPVAAAFVEEHAGTGEPIERAVRLYLAVRDRIRYDFFAFELVPEVFVGSNALQAEAGVCIPKAVALATAARAAGIPARIGFADVKNHLASPRILALMETDLFRWHAFTEMHLEGRWVKATPAFDAELCRRFGVVPLAFDGRSDSVFHEFTSGGARHMEYVMQRGSFDDVPYDTLATDLQAYYPRLLEAMAADRATRTRA
jgi:transglutaminase-like putative cysteine protease